jgi:hypothetical protein
MNKITCSRDEAKGLFRIILYLGTPKTWKEEENKNYDLSQLPEYINNLMKEINLIANTLEKIDPLKIIPSLKKSRDPEIKKKKKCHKLFYEHYFRRN